MTLVQHAIRLVFAFGCLAAQAQAGTISVNGTTCTLTQAINAANNVNTGGSANAGSCSGAMSGANTVNLPAGVTYTFTNADNNWYGPNALPAIQSDIDIEGFGATLIASHTGDPTPTAPNAFRFFYVSGGLSNELPAGSLTLHDLTLRGGVAKGGDAGAGGGGAGMGGAIFAQGSVTLNAVTLIGNSAFGGNAGVSGMGYAGGGMGQDAGAGGGFGSSFAGGFGGSGGGVGSGGGGGGGGGFTGSANGGGGISGNGGGGGGLGGLGGGGGPGPHGEVGGVFGDGGGGGGGNLGDTSGGTGGNFGFAGGGYSAGGAGGGAVGAGGGVGGLGGEGGGGGGFGGGGGAAFGGGASGYGGFGGGGGVGSYGGFGGGNSHLGASVESGGAGMAGAVFNHRGSVRMINVTATGNSANAGVGSPSIGNASGMGAVLFNLNGNVQIDFSTFAQNSVTGSNGGASTDGGDGTIYSLAYGNNIEDGTASSATLTINNSIAYGTIAGNGAANHDVVINVQNGKNTNAASAFYISSNIVGSSYAAAQATVLGSPSLTSDPHLGALSPYSVTTAPGTFPIGPGSPAYNAAINCNDAHGVPTTADERGIGRPQFGACDIGAYEYDGDYIFANGFN